MGGKFRNGAAVPKRYPLGTSPTHALSSRIAVGRRVSKTGSNMLRKRPTDTERALMQEHKRGKHAKRIWPLGSDTFLHH